MMTFHEAREALRDYMAPNSDAINVFAQTGEMRPDLVEAIEDEINWQNCHNPDPSERRANVRQLRSVRGVVIIAQLREANHAADITGIPC